MSNLLYRLINPPVKALLRSPLHGLLSRNTLLLEFTGRKSGRSLSTPISYHEKNGRFHCFTSCEFGWWRNLAAGRAVRIRVRGRSITVVPDLELENKERMVSALREFLLAVPRDAAHAGVRLGDQGEPSEEDIRRVVSEMVYLSFEPARSEARS